MILRIAVFCSILLIPVACRINYEEIYDGLVNEVINVKELEKTIRANIPGTNIEIDPAWSFLDAWTKIPSGILGGNFYDLGHFDECYGIHFNDTYGKYCLGTLMLSQETQKYFDAFNMSVLLRPQPRLPIFGPEYAGLRWAACVPHTVAAEDIPGLLTYTEDFCYSKATEPALSTGTIVTIVVFALFLTIAAASTAFDLYLFYTEKKVPHELFIAFSFLTNGRKIFKTTKNSDQLLCLSGIRVLSMIWVIIGHAYSSIVFAPVYNFSAYSKMQKDPANMFLMEATVSVDSFFVAGGLVTVYTYLKSMDKGVKFNIFLYYIHRYLRLTPALAAMALIHLYIASYLSTGPLWVIVEWMLSESCKSGWWSTFLYVTNYVQDGTCSPQGWYLSVDMQLYILSPIILIPLYKWPKPTLWVLEVLALAGCVVPFALGYSLDLGLMSGLNSTEYMNKYYTQTYGRFGPYVIGMILGYFLYKIKQKQLKIQMSKLTACFLWLICVTGLVACVYSEFPLLQNVANDDVWGTSLYMAFDRPAWALFLSGVIFLCVSGYGHPVDQFLSMPIFQVLAKLSYSMYLTHYAVILVRYASMKTSVRFAHTTFMHAFWGDFAVIIGLSLVLCLLFESPIIILEKYIFGRGLVKPQRQKANPEV